LLPFISSSDWVVDQRLLLLLRLNETGCWVDWCHASAIHWLAQVHADSVAVVGAGSRVARVLCLVVELLRVVVVDVARQTVLLLLVATCAALGLVERGTTAWRLSRIGILYKKNENSLKKNSLSNFQFG
jgi:hypothetical protein